MLNRFNENNLEKRFNKKALKSTDINKFDFEKGLISKNDEKNKFVNFFKYKDEIGYQIVEEYYIKYLYDDYSFLDDFILCELTQGNRTDRLLDIIKNIHGTKYKNSDLQYIFKLNNVKDKRIHFFIKKSRNNITLLLIDLYHLGIFGTLYIKGKPQHNSIEQTYKRYKNNKIALDEFKGEIDSINNSKKDKQLVNS